MTQPRKPPRPARGFAVVEPAGTLMIWSTRPQRKQAIASAVGWTESSWDALYARGYRVARVRIVPEVTP